MGLFDTPVANSSATIKTPDQQMWYYGGNQQGPSPATNPIRQSVGNFVESVGNMMPWRNEGYISEMIAGGPTKYTGQTYAAEPIDTGSATRDLSGITNTTPNPQPTGNTGGDQNALIQKYRDSGWTDLNAILADINAGGGSKFNTQGQGEIDQLNEEKRGLINSGWDSYINSLNQQMNEGLPAQAENLKGIIGNQFATNERNLATEQKAGLSDLGAEREGIVSNQDKNLKNLAENLRNMFMSGNVYLGSRGAGDSSAANQYAYALTKQGNKARGDVMSQSSDLLAEVGRRETKLNDVVRTELSNMQDERDNKILEVANWLETQKSAIRSQIGQAGVGRSQDLQVLIDTKLNQAMSYLQTINQEMSARRSALDQWAISQSDNINQLKANLQGISGFKANLPQTGIFSGTPQVSGGNYSLPIYSQNSTEDEEKRGLFS